MFAFYLVCPQWPFLCHGPQYILGCTDIYKNLNILPQDGTKALETKTDKKKMAKQPPLDHLKWIDPESSNQRVLKKHNFLFLFLHFSSSTVRINAQKGVHQIHNSKCYLVCLRGGRYKLKFISLYFPLFRRYRYYIAI